MSEQIEATQVILVDVVKKEDKDTGEEKEDLQLTPMPCEGELCKTSIDTAEATFKDKGLNTVTQMFATSVVEYRLSDECQKTYEMRPITNASGFGRSDVTTTASEQPCWQIEELSTFGQFVNYPVVKKYSVRFESVKMPDPGVEHACMFDLNVMSKANAKKLKLQMPSKAGALGIPKALFNFKEKAISHDPIIIVGKPK